MIRGASKTGLLLLLGVALYVTATFAFQREFREYGGERPTPLPTDYDKPAEFIFGHLMYPEGFSGGGFFGGRRGRRGNWSNDYPAADRHLMIATRRLTLIDARSVEQPVDLDDGDDVFNWPFLYAVRTIGISLNEEQTTKLREYIDRGGFFVADDMWGDYEHEAIFALMQDLYPKRELTELGDNDRVFHMLFDLNERYQILGQWARFNGMQPMNGGVTPHWKGLFDEKDRMVAAVWLNNDTGDSWEWADDPTYPEAWSALGFRIVLNHMVYAMTH